MSKLQLFQQPSSCIHEHRTLFLCLHCSAFITNSSFLQKKKDMAVVTMVAAKNVCFLFTDHLSYKWQELKKKPNTMMPFVIKPPVTSSYL